MISLSFRLEEMNGMNYVSPILNQDVAEVALPSRASQPSRPDEHQLEHSVFAVAFSPHIFSRVEGFCESGWQPGDAVSFLEETGVPDESCFPYASGATGDDQECNSSCEMRQSAR